MKACWQRSAEELAAAVTSGKLDRATVLEEHIEQRDLWQPHVHALLATADEAARGEIRAGTGGPLAGVPVVIKDNICTRGLRTTCGSRILENYVPPYDATVVQRLRRAGAVITAKTNCDEFAMGSSTENSAFGATRNPYDLQRVPGGSSGGSAVAVATGMAPIALGSETGGSVRQPASFTNLVGFKPTYGRLSRYGLVAFGSSLDQIGILARNVRDVALTYSIISGSDELDMTTLPGSALSLADMALAPGCGRGLSVGVPRNILEEGVDAEVRAAQERTEAALARAGVKIRDVKMVTPTASIAAYYVIATAEASSNLARFDGVRYGNRSEDARDVLSLYGKTRGRGFGREVKRRILLGTFALSAGYYDAYYLKALRARNLIRRDLMSALEEVDALLLPTSPTPAFRFGERMDDPLTMYLSDLFTIAANLCGTPAISVPGAFTCHGLPVGFQFMAGVDGEATLFRLAATLEEAHGEDRRWPQLPVRGDPPLGDLPLGDRREATGP